MFIDPISQLKLYSARVKGGMLWYCPHSRGRMVNMPMAKHFVLERGAVTRVSHAAHLGGISTGVVFWFLFGRSIRKQTLSQVEEYDSVTQKLLENQ